MVKKKAKQRKGASGWIWTKTAGHNHHLPPPAPPDIPVHAVVPTDASEDYMARSRRSPPMKDRWRAEEEPRERHPNRQRDKDKSERRARSPLPARRSEVGQKQRGREQGATDTYFPSRQRELSRDSRYSPPRRSSISPRRPPNSTRAPSPNARPLADRVTRPRSPSPIKPSKRRRTQSPSPARSDRYVPDRRRDSRSRERYEPRDRRLPGVDRAFSPRRSSPNRISKAPSRVQTPDIDSYIPGHRRREPSPRPARKPEYRPRSPRRRSRTPQPRHEPQRKAPAPPKQQRELSPYSARVLKTQRLATERSKPVAEKPIDTAKPAPDHPSSIPKNLDQGDSDSMDGQQQHTVRQNYNTHNNMMQNRPNRPFVDTRNSFGGSPPYSNPNSSYHGSPQSESAFHQGRGGWNNQHQNTGHSGQMHNSSPPPYRQNSYPGHGGQHNQNAYYSNQQQHHQQQFQGHHPQQGYQQQPFRGNHSQHRGGHFQQSPPDRRFSGPGSQGFSSPQRGRGGHFNNLQWTASNPKRGGPQGQNHLGSHSNSIQTSPAQSRHASRDSLEPSMEESENPFRPSKELQVEDEQRELKTGPSGKHLGNTQQKDASKISFAFKPKAPPSAPAKAAPDFNSKVKGPLRPSVDLKDRPQDRPLPPPTHPKGRHDIQQDRRDDRHTNKPFDRRNDFHNDKRAQHGRPPPRDDRPQLQNDRRPARSRSPPAKKIKHDVKPRPTLPPEMASSESIYYRKPGNESVVGAGTYGKVFKAIHIYTNDKVALKKIRMEGERDGFPITAVREIRLLQHLRHKHVVGLQEVMVEKNECFMVFEYLSHDLTGLINHPTFKLTSAHKKDLAAQMFEGLEFLHRRGVLHRDIKAANILISNTGQLKYADFGLARFYTKSRQLDYTNRVITIWYRPPELLLGETQYGPAVDIWSAACVFVEMFTKKAIFPGEGGELSQLEKVYNVLGTPARSEWPNLVELPWFELMQPAERQKRVFETMYKDVFTPAALDLVKQMFRYDPLKRPTAEEVLAHPYFVEEEPRPEQAVELEHVAGDWHEFESKAHRRENDKRERDRRKAEQHQREKEKRNAAAAGLPDPEPKRQRSDSRRDTVESTAEPEPVAEAEEDREEESEGEGSAKMDMS